MKNTKRIQAFDVIRVIAILSVIIIHAAAEYVDQSPYRSLEFMVGNVFDSIARIGVPLFVMLSGALMLNEDKQINIKKSVKSSLQIYCLLLFWSLFYAGIYYIAFPLFAHSLLWIPFSWQSFFNALAVGHYHFWYLYMIVGLYLITPILRLFVKRENGKEVLYFLIVLIIIKSVLPVICYFAEHFGTVGKLFNAHVKGFDFAFADEYLAYYLLGWYLVNTDISKYRRMILCVLGGVGVVSTILCTHLLTTETYKAYGFFYSYGNINVMSASVAVFACILYAFKQNRESRWMRIIACMSQLSFGVYMIHPLVLFAVVKLSKSVLRIPQSFCVSLLFEFSATLVVSFALAYCISRIPILKKLIKA